MSIKIQHTHKIKGSSAKEICTFLQHDLKNEHGWQAFAENNKVYWKEIKPNRLLLRKPTDYIQKGEIIINELDKGVF